MNYKVCKDCTAECELRDPNQCFYVKIANGVLKIKCKECSYKTNNWCQLYNNPISLVLKKCLEGGN